MIRARIRMFGSRMVVLLDKPRLARGVESAPPAACPPQGCGRVVMPSADSHVYALTARIARVLLAENGPVRRV
ncbi:MAG: hypothetical protein ABL977_00980 [Candidatus Eisenbacteria bacterium]